MKQSGVGTVLLTLILAASAGTPQDIREIVTDTGLDHGFLYRPIPAWVDPVLKWSSAGKSGSSGDWRARDRFGAHHV